MEPAEIQEITVVGGGTAGWLAAAILNVRLNAGRQDRRVKVVLIESPNVPIIGVGEGTVPAVVGSLKSLGIDEREFFRKTNASFKEGVRFEGWNLDDKGRPYSFVHPFGVHVQGPNTFYEYLTFGAPPGRDKYDVADSLGIFPEIIRLGRAPRQSSEGDYQGRRYSYHFDAPKVAKFLQDFSIERGVTHIVDDVDDVTIGENGHLTHLHLRQRGARPVELVLDCTGFKGELITKKLGEPFHSYGENLLCDRAIPIQIPHSEGAPLQVCTSATALGAGWVWKVPLFSRIGTGYVYSSAFRTDEEALREYCAHLGLDSDKVQARVIQMRVGRLRRAWVGNCIAVGLSGGFIEPLEATAIMAVNFAVRELIKNFPAKPIPSSLVDRFNKRMDALYNMVRDFIVMHYYASNRPEPFWVAARQPSVLSDALRENMELWAHRLPEHDDLQYQNMLFDTTSYSTCLISKGFYRDRKLSRPSNLSDSHWSSYCQQLERQRIALRSLPSARELIAHIRGEALSAA